MVAQGFELVFYGDSITETWRGTDLGKPCKRAGCKEAPATFQKHFSDLWRTGVLGVAGKGTNRQCGWAMVALIAVHMLCMVRTWHLHAERFTAGLS